MRLLSYYWGCSLIWRLNWGSIHLHFHSQVVVTILFLDGDWLWRGGGGLPQFLAWQAYNMAYNVAEWDRERGRKCVCVWEGERQWYFCNIIEEVTSIIFAIFVRKKSLDPAHTQGERRGDYRKCERRGGIIGDHLRGCPPHRVYTYIGSHSAGLAVQDQPFFMAFPQPKKLTVRESGFCRF